MESHYRAVLPREFRSIPQLAQLGAAALEDMDIVARVLPFKTNPYVVEQLIDWSRAPDDPIFQLVFPHREMLPAEEFAALHSLVRTGANRDELNREAGRIRAALNPHPANQTDKNVPDLDGERLVGLQHKYRETVLFFPKSAQTCHAYCAFCFRWPQFIEEPGLRFALAESQKLFAYLRAHREVTDLLVTGGDPMTMSSRRLELCLEPLMAPELDHVQNVRIGTKALSFWPHRFVSDPDADEVMRLIERLARAGKHVAIMAHINHAVELSTSVVQRAIARLRSAGAQIRSQSPVLRHVNDDPAVWQALWREQVKLGICPYYMFVARDTGARSRFDLPLARTLEIYREAIRGVSGLARTARGPSMSTSAGKIEIQGTAEVSGEQVFVLSFLQGRQPEWVKKPFFARFDAKATWIDDLVPAGGARHFFFET